MSFLVIDTNSEEFKTEVRELLTKYHGSEIIFITETTEEAIVMLKFMKIHEKQGPLIVIGPGQPIPKIGIGASITSILNDENFRDTFKENMIIKNADFLKPPMIDLKLTENRSFGEDMIDSSILKEDKREPNNQTYKRNYKHHK